MSTPTPANTPPITLQRLIAQPIDVWPQQLFIEPIIQPSTSARPLTIRPPGSKSLTNRALLLAALAKGTSTLTGALVEADDAQVMIRALRQLGATIDIQLEADAQGQPTANATLRITGVAGRWAINPAQPVTINLNNAGTATRFLTAAAILQPPTTTAPTDPTCIVIDGNARMRQRPIAELVDALRTIGARADYAGAEGFPPVRIGPCQPQAGRHQAASKGAGASVTFGRTSSSQFISALLLIAPLLPGGLDVHFSQPPTTPAYIRMTLALLERLGHTATGSIGTSIHVPAQELLAFDLAIEPDASGATYFIAAAKLIPSITLVIPGLDPANSLQGDAAFISAADALAAGPADLDMTDTPDAAMTAAVLACFANGTTTLRGLRTLRVKETDRIAALVTELAKVNVLVQPFAYVNAHGQQDEGVTITPPTLPGGTRTIDCAPGVPRVAFDTYDDHRMAMSLALIGLRRPNVLINDPACVRKTYPTFWHDLARLYS